VPYVCCKTGFDVIGLSLEPLWELAGNRRRMMGLVNINDKHNSTQLTILIHVESRNKNDPYKYKM